MNKEVLHHLWEALQDGMDQLHYRIDNYITKLNGMKQMLNLCGKFQGPLGVVRDLKGF